MMPLIERKSSMTSTDTEVSTDRLQQYGVAARLGHNMFNKC
jgi:hypothetical protein